MSVTGTSFFRIGLHSKSPLAVTLSDTSHWLDLISPSAISLASCTCLPIECTRCTRKGQYSLAKLIAQHGHRGNMSKWVSDLRGDCPKRNAPHLHDRYDLICRDLPKVLWTSGAGGS
jgi:hypothetical protein